MNPLPLIASIILPNALRQERQLMMASNSQGGFLEKENNCQTINECLDAINRQSNHGNIYKDWFSTLLHSLQTAYSSLNYCQDPDQQEVKRSIYTALTNYQFNAPYPIRECQRLDRQTTPLSGAEYIRCPGNILREMASVVLRIKLSTALKKIDLRLPEHRTLIPLTQACDKLPPPIYRNKPADLTIHELNNDMPIYITSLSLQIISEKDFQKTLTESTRCGLLLPVEKSAKTVTDYIVYHIDKQNIPAVMKLMTAGMKQAGLSVKTLRRFNAAEETLCANNLVGLNPHSTEYRPALASAWQQLQASENDTHYADQIIKQLKGIIGEDILSWLPEETSPQTQASLLDNLNRLNDAIRQQRNAHGACPKDPLIDDKLYRITQSIHHIMKEKTYGAESPTLQGAVSQLLPKPPLKVYNAPYANNLIFNISKSLGISGDDTAILKNSYFETFGFFPGYSKVNHATDSMLLYKKLIIGEISPNNACLTSVKSNDISELINYLYNKDTKASLNCLMRPPEDDTHTIIADLTTNTLQDSAVEQLINTAYPHIQSGHLNLILLQSGTKYYTLGNDNTSLGIAIIYNNNRGQWRTFNTTMQTRDNPIEKSSESYVASVLQHAPDVMQARHEQIRKNTQRLKQKLAQALGSKQKNAFKLQKNTDDQGVVIAINPRHSYLEGKLHQKIGFISQEKITEESTALLQNYLLPALTANGLPATHRGSLGFPITNLTLCQSTIRITPGNEEACVIDQYAELIIAQGKKAWEEKDQPNLSHLSLHSR